MKDLTAQIQRNSWRNQQRVEFIKGFYRVCRLVKELCHRFNETGDVTHDLIDGLLESHLRQLKDLSHVLYRTTDSEQVKQQKQRLFDKILGELWHELGKARDNVRLLEVYADTSNENDDSIVRSLNKLADQVIANAGKDLPKILNRTRRMIAKLVPLFEEILPLYKTNEIVFRTIYFSRKEFDRYCEPSAVEYFFPILFDSTESGYQELIRSLIRSKHIHQAQNVLADFRKWVSKHPKAKPQLHEAEDMLKAVLQ